MENKNGIMFWVGEGGCYSCDYGCSVIVQPATKWQKIPYLVLWDKNVVYANELYPV